MTYSLCQHQGFKRQSKERSVISYITCQECGDKVLCPHCSVGMSLYSNSNALKCHYCNFTQAIPKVCPNCNSTLMYSSRIGTAEVVKRLQNIFF